MQIKQPIFKAIIKPNSSKNEILGFDKARNAYRIAINTKPENNKANIELIKFLKKALKKDIKIIRGFTSKEKIIRVQ